MGLETGSDEFVPDLRVFDPTREKTRFTGTPHVATEILSTDQAADREAVSLVTIRESIQGFDQLLTAVSHDLRTPLTSLIGFIDTMLGPAAKDAAAKEKFLGIMRNQATRMSKLIDDVRTDRYGYLVVAVLLASTFLF